MREISLYYRSTSTESVQFDHLCKEQLTLDTIELYDEPIVLFTDVLCGVAKSCMPRATAKPNKRCKPWFNTECKDAMKARKSALVRFKKILLQIISVILGLTEPKLDELVVIINVPAGINKQ